MSSRGRNHTRGTMQAWREMAAEGDGGNLFFPFPEMPQLLGRNARWRPIVRLLAKQRGWRFIDAFLHIAFGDHEADMQLMRNLNHMGSVLQRHGLAKPWCCAFHQGGGAAIEYCAGGPPKPETTDEG